MSSCGSNVGIETSAPQNNAVVNNALFHSNPEVHTSLLHYCTFGLGAANDVLNVRADTAREKDKDQQNISKMISDIVAYITKLLQMPEDTIIQFISYDRQTATDVN